MFDIIQVILEITIIAFIAYLTFFKVYLKSYSNEKGKNLATYEDIEELTHKVEGVKTQYALIAEQLRLSNQLEINAVSREQQLKKEVFMEAVEAVTRNLNALSSFANLELDNEALTSANIDNAGKIAKVQIVASAETVNAVTLLMGELGVATMDLLAERMPLLEQKKDILINKEKVKAARQDEERYLKMMENYQLQGQTDASLWRLLIENKIYYRQIADEFQDTIVKLYDEHTPRHLAFCVQCMDAFFRISELVPHAVLAIRRELDLPIEEKDYIDIYTKNMKVGREVFDAFTKRVTSALNQ